MVYEVVITDKGSLDAKVTTAKLNCGNNSAIKCQVGVYPLSWENEGFIGAIANLGLMGQGSYDFSSSGTAVLSGDSIYLYVVAAYNEDITEQPENLNADVTAEMNFVQAD